MEGKVEPEDAESRKRIKIALVLNGGVSLAVWIGGVVHELDRLRRAGWELGAEGRSTAWSEALQAAGNPEVQIDVVAGTSAGGLNGAILAKAIAQGTPLPEMKAVWSGVGDLAVDKLIRSDAKGATSVLNGDFFTRAISGVLGPGWPRSSPADRAEECTLMITATELRSPVRTVETSGSVPTSVKDGRRVYLFRRREGTPVEPAVDHFAKVQPLATAMRASASFPFAFDPVEETPKLRERRENTAESVRPADGRRTVLVDGGLLDNAPLEPLLTELVGKPIAEPLERLVVYVTPSAESESPAGFVPPLPPPPADLAKAIFETMREPDQRLDYDRLASTFESMNLAESQPHSVLARILEPESAPAHGVEDLISAAEAILPQYRRSRTEAALRTLEQARAGDAAPLRPASEIDVDTASPLPGIPDSLKFGSDWTWGVPTADRILRWVGRAVSKVDGTLELVDSISLDEAQRVVRDLIARRDVAIRIPADGDDADALDQQIAALTAFYAEHRQLLTDTMRPVVDALASATSLTAERAGELLLALEVLYCSFNWGGAAYDTPRFHYLHLTPAVPSPDWLEVPAELVDKWPSYKLYGQRWNNFGAFASEAGRHHDWLWGRLDATETMVDQLLRTSTLDPEQRTELKQRVIDEILAEETVSRPEVNAGVRRVLDVSGKTLFADWYETNGRKAVDKLLDAATSTVFGAAAGSARNRAIAFVVLRKARGYAEKTAREGRPAQPKRWQVWKRFGVG